MRKNDLKQGCCYVYWHLACILQTVQKNAIKMGSQILNKRNSAHFVFPRLGRHVASCGTSHCSSLGILHSPRLWQTWSALRWRHVASCGTWHCGSFSVYLTTTDTLSEGEEKERWHFGRGQNKVWNSIFWMETDFCCKDEISRHCKSLVLWNAFVFKWNF